MKKKKKRNCKKDKIGTRMLRKCNYAQRALCSFTLLPALDRVEFKQTKSSLKRTLTTTSLYQPIHLKFENTAIISKI